VLQSSNASAQRDNGFFQGRYVLLQTSHSGVIILNVIAKLQSKRVPSRREGQCANYEDYGSKYAHAFLLFGLSVTPRSP
jgi:hypothetical protein